MKPTHKVAETTAPNGAIFELFEHDGEYQLHMDRHPVMTTTMTHSEKLLAEVGCRGLTAPRVLIGGLGLGYSLRRALELTGKKSKIFVAELLPEVVRWNRECLKGLNDDIISDPRCVLCNEDVYQLILAAANQGPKYDAILLDVDDGPSRLIQPQNEQLYGQNGLELIKTALNPGGRLAIWTAGPEPRLLKAMRRCGFRAEEIACAKHAGAKRKIHRIYVGRHIANY
jgi:spermidine synthase